MVCRPYSDSNLTINEYGEYETTVQLCARCFGTVLCTLLWYGSVYVALVQLRT